MSSEVKNIRLKLMFVFLLPALGLLYFSAGDVYEKFTLYQRSQYLDRVVQYARDAAALTREIQKERGISLAFLSGKKPDYFHKKLIQQRQRTDEAYRRLSDFLWRQENWQGEKRVKNFLSFYSRLKNIRQSVDHRGAPVMDIFEYYSELADRLIRTTETLEGRFISESFSRTIKSFEEILTLTEISGRERALIAALLESPRRDAQLEQHLVSLEKEYEDLYRRFIDHATIHTIQIFHRHLSEEQLRSYESLRRQIVFAHRYDLLDSRQWWKRATDFINSLYRIDFALLQHLDELKEAQKSEAIRTLTFSIILWAVFLLMLYALALYIVRIIEGFEQTIRKSSEEARLYKAFAEFSEYLVFHRNEELLLNSLTTLLYQTGHFRYLWLGRCGPEGIEPLYSENISVAAVAEELTRNDKENQRIKMALEQLRQERNHIHLEPHTHGGLFFQGVRELGFFPILRDRECTYVLATALGEEQHYDRDLVDLLQKMCNSLGSTLEHMEVEAQEQRLKEELRIAATAFNAHEAITITDATGTILQVNDAFTRITGYSAEEAIGNNPSILKSGKHDRDFYVEMWDSIRKEGFWKGEIYNRRKNGEIYPEMLSISSVRDQEGKITHYVAHFFDITEIKNAQRDAEYRAQHDPLTDLYNRQKLLEELQRIYQEARISGNYGAFIFMDLDNFKQINDSYNHEVGDRVLMEVSRRLQEVVHSEDLLARIAGDEFGLILCCLGTDREMATKKVTIVVEKIKNLFSQPVVVDGETFEITFSIGIKLFPDRERQWDEVMINADVAMYHAKKSGKNRYNFFDETLDQESKRFLRLKNAFSQALANRELVLHYQPRLEIAGNRIVGMEALVRWNDPRRGLVYPDDFLFVTLGNTLGYELNLYVLDMVLEQIRQWRRRHPDFDLRVSINISGEQFNSPSYIEQTLERLRNAPELCPFLELEIIEDDMLRDFDHTIKVIREFKELGVGFCMDDFGTGYSSIEYLKKLPVDIVKIDRGFIMDLFRDRNDEVVKLIVKTAEIFGMATVAEGVEDAQALEYLRQIGCRYYQGFYFSPAVPADEIERLFTPELSRGGKA